MTTLPNLPLSTWDPGNAQPDLLYNALLSIVDALLPTPVVADKDLTAPPGSPAIGSLYIVASPATGLWEGKEGQLVSYTYANAWMFIPPKADWLVRVADEDANYRYDGSAWNLDSGGGGSVTIPVAIQAAASDESTAITTGTAKITFRLPYAFTLTDVRASLSTASSSGNPQIDINMNGSSVLSTPITIDATEKTSVTAATPPVISTSAMTDDAEMTIDVDTAGTGAKGLKVTLIGTKTA